MAKQNKINKKREKRRARKSIERQDYRQGGRVALQRGGLRGMSNDVREQLLKDEPTKPVDMGRPVVPTKPIAQPVADDEPQPIEYSEEELGRQININPEIFVCLVEDLFHFHL